MTAPCECGAPADALCSTHCVACAEWDDGDRPVSCPDCAAILRHDDGLDFAVEDWMERR